MHKTKISHLYSFFFPNCPLFICFTLLPDLDFSFAICLLLCSPIRPPTFSSLLPSSNNCVCSALCSNEMSLKRPRTFDRIFARTFEERSLEQITKFAEFRLHYFCTILYGPQRKHFILIPAMVYELARLQFAEF